jgi:hypothetical protein
MVMLTISPISLLFQDTIQVRVAAINLIGQSAWSENNAETTVREKPTQMPGPTRGLLTNENQIQVDIAPLELSDTGDSTILAYQIMWDNGSGTLD